MENINILFGIIGFFSFLIVSIFFITRKIGEKNLELASLRKENEILLNSLGSKDMDLALLQEKQEVLFKENLEDKEQLSSLLTINKELERQEEESRKKEEFLQNQLLVKEEENRKLLTRATFLETSLDSEKAHSDEKLAILEEAKATLTKEFENLSHKIYDEKSKKFTQSSTVSLENLLKPFKEDILKFEKRVEETYTKEAKERFSLAKEVENLANLNKKISEDAINLTNALKNQVKVQGNWGEMILERILEESGLRKDHEYKIQESLKSDEGKTYRPDVVVFLPDKKQVIIDSKVSLKAYEQYIKAKNEEKEGHLKDHLQSLNNHLKELSGKNYHDLDGVTSLDFVLMFVPIEGAFLCALEKDNNFFTTAFSKKILIVSPSTLTVTLKTIENIWKYEHQNKNALEIGEKAGRMLDKFSGFIEDLEKVDRNIDTTKRSIAEAKNKLSLGSGNLVKRANELMELGVKSAKYQQKVLKQ